MTLNDTRALSHSARMYIPSDTTYVLRIAQSVAARTHIAVWKVLSTDRHKPVVAARFTLYLALRLCRPDFSSVRIGRLLHRDHASVLNGIAKARTWPWAVAIAHEIASAELAIRAASVTSECPLIDQFKEMATL